MTDDGCREIGHIDKGGYESMWRVCDKSGMSPTLHTCGGGNLEVKVLEEPQAMRLMRSEECKAKRRATHDEGMTFNEGKYGAPREDGILNTLTTFDKDNYIAMPIVNKNSKGYEEAYPGDGIDLSQPNSETQRGRVQHEQSQTLTTHDALGVASPGYRIRKLTERECFRLMGVRDEDSERIHEHQSKSSMYHLAGDSIVTSVLMGIFGEMFNISWEDKVKILQDDLTKEKNNG